MLNFMRVKYTILTKLYISKTLYILSIDKWCIILTILMLVKKLFNDFPPHLVVFFCCFFFKQRVKGHLGAAKTHCPTQILADTDIPEPLLPSSFADPIILASRNSISFQEMKPASRCKLKCRLLTKTAACLLEQRQQNQFGEHVLTRCCSIRVPKDECQGQSCFWHT